MKKLTSILLAVMLVVSMCCVGVVASAADDTAKSYYVVGSVQGWDPVNADPMTDNGDGTWTKTYTVDADAEFKVLDAQGPWDSQNSYDDKGQLGPGGANAKATVTEEGSELKIVFDTKAMRITGIFVNGVNQAAEIDPSAPTEEPTEKPTIDPFDGTHTFAPIGTFPGSNWVVDVTDFDMDYDAAAKLYYKNVEFDYEEFMGEPDDDGLYEATFEFKVTADHAWDHSWNADNEGEVEGLNTNTTLYLSSDGDTVRVDRENNEVYGVKPDANGKFVITFTFNGTTVGYDVNNPYKADAPTDPQPTDPQPTDPQPTDPQPTDPQPTVPVEDHATITLFEGSADTPTVTREYNVGDEFTYSMYLQCERADILSWKLETYYGVDGKSNIPSENQIIELIPMNGTRKYTMEAPFSSATVNAGIANRIPYNFTSGFYPPDGVDYTAGVKVVTFKFKVTGAGSTSIWTKAIQSLAGDPENHPEIREDDVAPLIKTDMSELNPDSTYVKPTEPQPTDPQPTEPQPTEPQPTQPAEFDPFDGTHTFAPVGSFPGSGWDITKTDFDMVYDEATKTWSKDVVFNYAELMGEPAEDGTYETSIEFKVAADHAWDHSWNTKQDGEVSGEGSNTVLYITSAGDALNLDLENEELTGLVPDENGNVTFTFTFNGSRVGLSVKGGTSVEPTTPEPTTPEPTTPEPTTPEPTTPEPTDPSTEPGTEAPTSAGTSAPTSAGTSAATAAGTSAATSANGTTTNNNKTTGSTSSTTGKVATGDSTSIALLLGVLLLAAGAVVVTRKKITEK